MQDNEIRALFREVFNNEPNAITPVFLEVGHINDSYVYELSRQNHHKTYSFIGRDCIGVTVINLETESNEPTLGSLCSDLTAANEYLKVLKVLLDV